MWFHFVAVLRFVGQAYTWLRVTMLIRGCYLARIQEPRVGQSSVLTRTMETLRAMILIPSQVVIYGSLFPIFLYLIAHLVDSAAVYEIIAAHFNTSFGLINFDLRDFLRQCTVSMRTVWVISYLIHTALRVATSGSWSPIHGIPGMAELSITCLAVFTILVQYRSITFRNTGILQVHEIVSSARKRLVHSETHGFSRSVVANVFFSSTIEWQALACGVVTFLLLALMSSFVGRVAPRWVPYRLTFASRTVVPYSAGALWPLGSLVVSWFGSPVTKRIHSNARAGAAGGAITPTTTPAVGPFANQLMLPTAAEEKPYERRHTKRKSLIVRDNVASRKMQQDMQTVDTRSQEIDAMVYLINLALMTDPITFVRLRCFGGRLVGLFKSKVTERLFLLPYALVASNADIPLEWSELELLAVVNSKDLEWHDLLRCG